MSEKEKDDLLKEAEAVINVIKAQHEKEIINYYDIVPLNDKNTREEIGFGVQMTLNTSYGYSAKQLTKWKRLLKADDWVIYASSYGGLSVTFITIYKKEGNV